MPTLLMRLEAPMQSYGIFGRFYEKDSGTEPSKSAVMGLVCSALGIERKEDISWLAAYKFGVRIDQEGIIRNDYHVAGNEGYYRADGKVETEDVIPSNRYYLADASFLVGLESEDRTKLEEIQAALKSPKWQLFLGKKSFVPAVPIWIENGIVEDSLLKALEKHEFNWKFSKNTEKITLRYVVDAECCNRDDAVMLSKVMDVPANFASRVFTERETATLSIEKIKEEE